MRLILLAMLLVLSGCDRRAATPVVRIGVLMNLEGSEGGSTRLAARLAIADFTTDGDIDAGGDRRRVELLFEDTRTAPETAIHGARRLIQQGVVAIIGPGRSREAIAAGGVAEHARIPLISPSSTHPQTTAERDYVFRVAFTDTFQGQALGRFAAEGLGARTAAALFDAASAFNRNLATEFRRAFEAAGGALVAFESYATGETDFSHQLERIRVRRPAVLLLPNYSEEIPQQVHQVRESGIDATILGGDAWTVIPFADLPELEGSFFAQHWHVSQADTHSVSQRFLQAYRQTSGIEPTDHAALTYDAFGLLFAALAAAGDDPDQIRQNLAGTQKYQGVTGTIGYRGLGGDPDKGLFIARIEDGAAVLYQAIEAAAGASSAVRSP